MSTVRRRRRKKRFLIKNNCWIQNAILSKQSGYSIDQYTTQWYETQIDKKKKKEREKIDIINYIASKR